MKQAVKGASKWLIENAKHNPIPYKLFKSILDKQIEWAKSRGVTLDFNEFSDAVRAELLKVGIHTMSPDGKQPEHTTDKESHFPIPALTLSLRDDEPTLPALFRWLYRTFDKAIADSITELRFSVSAVKESGHA